MAMDQELLQKAKGAGERLAEAERQALLSRTEYHTAIRRLHLAGASLREIAQALGISHQRVQQVVESAGGSWWQKIWRTRNQKSDMVCTFCQRDPSEVSKLLAGPDVYICGDCVSLAEERLGGAAGEGAFQLAPQRSKAKCSFCGKPGNQERALLLGGGANLCVECTKICREILTQRG